MKLRSSSSNTKRLGRAAWFMMILAGSSVLSGCDNSKIAPGQDGIQQIQTFLQDFAREILAAYLF